MRLAPKRTALLLERTKKARAGVGDTDYGAGQSRGLRSDDRS
jgi:hypothetical protein